MSATKRDDDRLMTWKCRACGHEAPAARFQENADARALNYCPSCGSPNTGPAPREEEKVDGLLLSEASADQLREKLKQNVGRLRRYQDGPGASHAAMRVLQFADELTRRAASLED